MKLRTPEEQRFWLAVYEANAPHGLTGEQVAEVADRAVVEDWRSRVETQGGAEDQAAMAKVMADQAETLQRLAREAQERADELASLREKVAAAEEWKQEADLARTQLDAARSLLDDVRRALQAQKVPDEGLPAVGANIIASCKSLRAEVFDLRSKLAVVNDLHDKAVAAQDRLLTEHSRLQKDFAAMKERLAEAEKQLAGVRIILEASGVPARGTLEERLRAGLVELTDALRAEADCAKRIKAEDVKTRRALADLVVEHHEGQLHEHQGYDLLTCQKLICYRMREIHGAGWLDVLRAAGRRERGAGAKAP